MCNHKRVIFTGIQETLNPEKPLLLFNCLKCDSTISLNKKTEFEIIFNGSVPEIIGKRIGHKSAAKVCS